MSAMQRLNPDGLHKPIGCYSQVVRQGNMVVASGMASLDLEGRIVAPNDAGAQTTQTIANLKAALEGAGARLEDVAKVTVYLADFADYPAMDAAYRQVFGAFPPARATLKVELVYPELLVELEAWAILPEKAG
ncbi:MAG: RidA family protein [Rhizobiaceae bacterium]|nr:RidA family protein [Rhizobiaceae bacterium]